jgi:hypothetical protein
MGENRELMELNKHLTDAEIMLAIRYLDPDSCTKKTRVGSVASICIPLLTALAVALTYIGFYVWTL